MSEPTPPRAGSPPEDPRLLPFGVLLDRAMGWTRRYLLRVGLPLAIPVAVLSALMATVQAGMMSSAFDPGGAPEAAMAAMGCVLPLVIVAVIVGSAVFYSAITISAVDAVTGREVSPKRSLRFVFEPPVLGTLFLLGLFTGVSYMCCLLPVLYVGPLLALTVPAMVDENLRGMDAIQRSVRLTRYNPRGRFLSNPLTKAFVLFTVSFLLSLLLSIATSTPFQIAQQWFMFRDVGNGGAGLPPSWIFWLQVPASALSSIVSSCVWLYTSFGLALLYQDTRRRKEGLDLEAAISRLERARGGPGIGRPEDPSA